MGDFDEGGTQDLQQFVLLAQSARGAACAALIRKVLAHPKVFVFGELLALPSVQDLQGTEHAPALALLNTFAYGTWSDLAPDAAAALEPAMALKLKKLSVVSMCASADVLAYDVLQRAVAISSVRELEDLLISLIYDGLLRGKLDQRSNHIEVAHAIGRDVHPDEVAQMAAKLQRWCAGAGRAAAGRCWRAWQHSALTRGSRPRPSLPWLRAAAAGTRRPRS